MDKQKIFNFALKTFLFLSPIFVFKDFKPSFSRSLFFMLGTFALFVISLACEPRRRFSNPWVALLLALAFVRMFFDNSMGSKTAEWINFWISCAGFMYAFCGALLFYIVYCYVDERENYFYPILAVCILNALLSSLQFINKDLDFMWYFTPSPCGFMDTSSQLGQYSAMSLPIILCLNPYFSIIPLVSLFLSKSISPIVACAVGMGLFGALRGVRAKISVGIGVLVVLLGILNFGYIKSKFECRPVMWQKTLKTALKKPFLGWGYRSFHEEVLDIKAKGSVGKIEFSRAHNDYLHTAQELGFPIVICAAMFFIGLYREFWKKRDSKVTVCLATSVFIVLVNMGGQTLIRYSSMAGTFIVLLALFCIKVKGGDDAYSFASQERG